MRVRGYAPATPCWAELTCRDIAAATSFYCGLFGWQADELSGDAVAFTLRGLTVAGVTTVDDARSAWLPYISTDDLAATAEAVSASGGVVLRPPADVGTRGRAALFTDAEGAVFGAWQRGSFAGAQVVSEPNAVCWSEVASWDLAGASTFYHKTFGWSDRPGELDTGVDYREWHVHSRVVAGLLPMQGNFPPETPPHWRVTVEVDECAPIAARCTELGGQVLAGPMDVGVGQYAQLCDPVGGTLGVIELLPHLRLTP